ncbi:hypothetical protein J2Z19_003753 [Ensifer adhaerens]|uniref:Uncharacterized protein n=1 Tax=Ensifer adhaerens TaxID=106592 RepID=A0ACC5SZB9_ENSAD|nr:hypothetical protein [Ensifer adhaerens]MBP1874029.1 hypothetical protein [Ensifer adhaerens]
MVPNKGTIVPTREHYAIEISQALKEDIGINPAATKTIMRWTGASDRAVKYWLNGEREPGGWHLVQLARNSDAVLHAFLHMAGRDLFEVSIELNAAQVSLARAAAIISALAPRR